MLSKQDMHALDLQWREEQAEIDSLALTDERCPFSEVCVVCFRRECSGCDIRERAIARANQGWSGSRE